jgi:hypothetical protein
MVRRLVRQPHLRVIALASADLPELLPAALAAGARSSAVDDAPGHHERKRDALLGVGLEPRSVISVFPARPGLRSRRLAHDLASGLARGLLADHAERRVVLLELPMSTEQALACLGGAGPTLSAEARAALLWRARERLSVWARRQPAGVFRLRPHHRSTLPRLSTAQVSHLLGHLAHSFDYVICSWLGDAARVRAG